MPDTPPSPGWVATDSLDAGANKTHARIRTVLTTANLASLQAVALLARKAQDESLAQGITCSVDTKFLSHGMNNLVLRVVFSDNVDWIARIQYAVTDPSHAHKHKISMLSEIATMKTLNSRTTIPVPQVYAFDTSPANNVGFPYLRIEHLKGRILDSTIAGEVPAEYTSHVCGENCDEAPRIIAYEWNTTEPLATPRDQTSLEWFYEFRQAQNRRALEKHAHDAEWRAACWVLKTALSHIIIEDRVRGPFPLCHFDLHYGNLLFDDQYNLTGVIDWSQTATAPLERLAVSPELITFPGLPDRKNQVIVDFSNAVRDCLQSREDEAWTSTQAPMDGPKTTLSSILGTVQAEITHRCTYSRPHRAVCDARLVSSLVYETQVAWEQLVSVYGTIKPY